MLKGGGELDTLRPGSQEQILFPGTDIACHLLLFPSLERNPFVWL